MADNPFLGTKNQQQSSDNPFVGSRQSSAVSGPKLETDPRFGRLMDIYAEAQEANSRGILGMVGQTLSFQNFGRSFQMDQLMRELADEYDTDYQSVNHKLKRVSEMGGLERFFESDQWQRELGVAEAGGRFVGQAAELLTVPQDIGFATLEAALNPEVTVQSRLNEMDRELGAYFDIVDPRRLWSDRGELEFAERTATFGDVMRTGARAAGVEDQIPEGVYRWGGMAGDIVVDPLLFGTVLKGIGKATKLPALAKTGQQFEALPRTIVGDIYRRGTDVAGAAGRVASPNSSGEVVRQAIENRAATWANSVLNTELLGGRAMPFTGKSETVSSFFGIRNPMRGDKDVLSGGAGTPLAAEEASRQAQRSSSMLIDDFSDRMEQLQNMLGRDRAKGWTQNVMAALGLHRRIPDRLATWPTDLKDQLTSLVFETVDNRGVLLDPTAMRNLEDVVLPMRTGGKRNLFEELAEASRARGDTPGIPTRDELRSQVRQTQVDELDEAGNVIGRRLETPEEALGRTLQSMKAEDPARFAQSLMRANIERVRDIATKNRFDPNVAQRTFEELVSKTTEADAILGYHMSLYGPIKEAMFERALAKGADPATAQQLWEITLREGMMGNDPTKVDVTELFGRSSKLTIGDVMGRTGLAGQLRIGDYVQGLQNGHLRRTYSMFQDDDFFNSWSTALEKGQLLPSQYLGQKTIDNVAARGFGPETEALQKYMKRVSPTLSDERGLIVRQDRLASYMKENLSDFDQGRFDNFMSAMASETSPQIKDFLDDVRELRSGYQRSGDMWQRFETQVGTLGKSEAAERQVMSPEFLERLGQAVDPEASLVQSARSVAKQLPVNQAYADIYKYAEKNGYVYKSLREVPDDLKHLYRDGKIEADNFQYGPFAGRVIPTPLVRALDNIAADSRSRNSAFQRARSLVQGGFLASPSATFANVSGGFYTAALYGINPLILAKNMMGVAIDYNKQGRKLPELHEAGAILTGGMRQQEFARFSKEIGRDISGISDEAGFMGWLRDLPSDYMRWLENPLGAAQRPTAAGKVYNAASGALGLKAFSYFEDLFKLGTYRMMKAQGKDQRRAMELARNVVFDYSSQPGAVQMARNSGLIPFPSFPYFMIGRTMDAAINRPGTLAAFSRIPEAIWNAQIPDEDTKLALLAGMRDYQKEEKYVPMWEEGGDYHMLPAGQIFPTGNFGSHFTEGFFSGGLWTPLMDVANAIGTQSGRATESSAKFGQSQVWERDANLTQKISQGVQFTVRNFMPANARKMMNPGDPGGEVEGLVPEIYRHLTKVPDELAGTQHTIHEIARGKADKGVWDSALAMFVRSPAVVSLAPETSSVFRTYQMQSRDNDEKVAAAKRRAREAALEGNIDLAMRESTRAGQMEMEFMAEWMPRIKAYINWLQQRGLETESPIEQETDTGNPFLNAREGP